MKDINQYAAEIDELLPQLAVKLLRFVRDMPYPELTVPQAFLLHHLHSRGPCTASTVAEMMGITSGPVTSITKRLIGRGWVDRRQDETDRRVVWFSLTPDGEGIVARLCVFSRAKWATLLQQLGAERAEAAIALMKDAIHVLNQQP